MSAISADTTPSPRALGFRMPAEWERHEATWLTWPRSEGISFPDAFETIPALWADLAKLLAEGEQVHINVFSPEHEIDIRAALKKANAPVDKRIHLHLFPHTSRGVAIMVRSLSATRANLPWSTGATTPGAINIRHAISMTLYRNRWRSFLVCASSPPMILEGGSIEVNGAGALLTTEACLLNKNRNPNLTQKEIEHYLREYLGVEQILWLGEGIVGDDTDGHIDDLTRFVDATTLVTIMEEDPTDENYTLLRENRARLNAMRDPGGRPWRIVELPMPGRIEKEGQRLPASYANFYIANEVVVVPGFDHPNDAKARDILQSLFPTRRVVMQPALDLLWGLGAFHCITQQQPEAP